MSGRWAGSDRRAHLPSNWTQLRLERFALDDWTCVDCGWHDPTGRTLECDHIGHRTDHRIEQLRTRCGPKAPRNCHGRATSQRANAQRHARPPDPPHPGLRRHPPGGHPLDPPKRHREP